MLHPTEAIAIAPAISSAHLISSAPASSSTPAGLSSAQRPRSLWESPDPSARTLEPTGHGYYGLPLAIPERHPERAGIPKLEGGCHSSLGSSGDIIIPHSGVSRGHRNVPHASDSHYTTSPDSSGLLRPPSWTLLL